MGTDEFCAHDDPEGCTAFDMDRGGEVCGELQKEDGNVFQVSPVVSSSSLSSSSPLLPLLLSSSSSSSSLFLKRVSIYRGAQQAINCILVITSKNAHRGVGRLA